MPTKKSPTLDELEAELERMRAERTEDHARMAAIEARPESPHAKVIREYDEDHQRRVAAGRALVADQEARDAAWLEQNTRQWVKLTCRDADLLERTTDRSLMWKEIDADVGDSVHSHFAPKPGAGHWVSGEATRGNDRMVSRTHSLHARGFELLTADEFAQRLARSARAESPNLCEVVKDGQLVVENLSREECISIEHGLIVRGRQSTASIPEPGFRPAFTQK